MSEPPASSKPPRGFARLTPERRSEIARKAGQASAASGRGHRFTKDSAKEAGRKGGLARSKKEQADV